MGIYLSAPNTHKHVETKQNNNLRYTSCEMQGWRKGMEDAKISQVITLNGESYTIFGVFDGHGGAEVSLFVAAHFIPELIKNQQFKSGNIVLALEQNFRRMDEMLEGGEYASELKQFGNNISNQGPNSENISDGVGCTANVVVIDKSSYYVANSGDSRAVLCRAGKAIELSEDHKPQGQIQKNRIHKAGGSIIGGRVNGGLNLTRALGDLQFKKNQQMGYKQQMITCHPDVKVVPRNPKDEYIIMGCDGIWQKYVSHSQGLIDYINQNWRKHKDPKVLLTVLFDKLLAKNTQENLGCDNMTSILVEILKVK